MKPQHARKTPTETMHSPTPYLLNQKGDYWQVLLKKSNGIFEEIASCIQKKDAAFIVQACNAHEALVESLKDCAAILDMSLNSSALVTQDDIDAVLTKTNALIIKLAAKGDPQ